MAFLGVKTAPFKAIRRLDNDELPSTCGIYYTGPYTNHGAPAWSFIIRLNDFDNDANYVLCCIAFDGFFYYYDYMNNLFIKRQ